MPSFWDSIMDDWEAEKTLTEDQVVSYYDKWAKDGAYEKVSAWTLILTFTAGPCSLCLVRLSDERLWSYGIQTQACTRSGIKGCGKEFFWQKPVAKFLPKVQITKDD